MICPHRAVAKIFEEANRSEFCGAEPSDAKRVTQAAATVDFTAELES